MNSKLLLTFVLGGLLFAGCVKPTTKPTEPTPAPTATPVPERTLGDVTISPRGAALVQYKDINILIDPMPGEVIPEWPAIDYLFLTDARSLDALVEPPFRKSLKIIATASVLPQVQKKGYVNVKAISAGQRIYLKKSEAYLFASAVVAKGADPRQAVNSYLMEFDNGRNVFVGGLATDMAPLREFVYSLRDDGRELYLTFLPGTDAAIVAEQTALLQPQFTFSLPPMNDDKKTRLDLKAVKKALTEQLYNGVFAPAEPGKKIPF